MSKEKVKIVSVYHEKPKTKSKYDFSKLKEGGAIIVDGYTYKKKTMWMSAAAYWARENNILASFKAFEDKGKLIIKRLPPSERKLKAAAKKANDYMNSIEQDKG